MSQEQIMSLRKFHKNEGEAFKPLVTDRVMIIRDDKEIGSMSLGGLIKLIGDHSEIVSGKLTLKPQPIVIKMKNKS